MFIFCFLLFPERKEGQIQKEAKASVCCPIIVLLVFICSSVYPDVIFLFTIVHSHLISALFFHEVYLKTIYI